MTRIEDEDTLQLALASEHAVLLLHAEWSIYSMHMLRSVERWEREVVASGLSAGVKRFIAVNGTLPYPAPLESWLKTQGLEAFASSGNGEVLWLERGRVVSKLFGRRDGASIADLTRRTAELWGLE
jgi:hypothetical protein